MEFILRMQLNMGVGFGVSFYKRGTLESHRSGTLSLPMGRLAIFSFTSMGEDARPLRHCRKMPLHA